MNSKVGAHQGGLDEIVAHMNTAVCQFALGWIKQDKPHSEAGAQVRCAQK